MLESVDPALQCCIEMEEALGRAHLYLDSENGAIYLRTQAARILFCPWCGYKFTVPRHCVEEEK